LARERYLLHAGEDTIHDPEAEKKAVQADKTPHGKWENFWYYNKWKVIFGLFVAVVVVWSIVSSVTAEQADYTVGLLTEKGYPDSVLDTLCTEMEKYGKDLNGDGKVVVQVSEYVLPGENSADTATSISPSSDLAQQQQNLQMLQAYQAKWISDMSVGTSMILISDNANFMQQVKTNRIFAYIDGSTPSETATDYDNMRVSIAKCPKLANIDVTLDAGTTSVKMKLPEIMSECSISIRRYKGTAIDGKADDYYNASLELLKKIIS
jgi:hypothetical protein